MTAAILRKGWETTPSASPPPFQGGEWGESVPKIPLLGGVPRRGGVVVGYRNLTRRFPTVRNYGRTQYSYSAPISNSIAFTAQDIALSFP